LKPIDLFRLQPAPGDRGLIVVSIWQNPGHNHLMDILDMGPAFYKAQRVGDTFVAGPQHKGEEKVSLDRFLDFAIGAAQCLEVLHHSLGMIHGEIRGDAFHYNADDGQVRIASFGSGMRSFEHGLTSAGWSSLSKELGAKNKLYYISPEQTGRMPAEPDSRTDIYSLGVLLWIILAQEPPFEGDSPLDIVQGVLGRRIPNVATIRVDIPETIGRIIQKCTAKNIGDRYHSASGLRTDLVQVQKYLADGDSEAVNNMKIGSKDVSSFFMLPSTMIGRQKEKVEIMKVIDRVAKSHAMSRKSQTNRFSDGSSLSNEVVVFDDVSSEGGSSAGADRRSGSFSQAVDQGASIRHSGYHSTLSDAYTISNETVSSNQSILTSRLPKPWERHQSLSADNRSLVDSVTTDNRHSLAESTSTSLSRQLGSAKFRRRGHCEVITIEGAGGLGKSCLVQSVLADARRRGYCATAKFDTARRTAFGPLLKLLSSLFKQVWGERNTETPFHQMLKQYIRPVWPMLHRVLNLPEFLLGPQEVSMGRTMSSMHSGGPGPTVPSRPTSKSFKSRRESSPGISPGARRNSVVPPQSSQEFLRSGSSTKTTRLMNVFLDVLRVFTQHKFICFCLDDLHFADEESLELISQIVGTRMKMVVIMTYRPEELASERMHSLLVPTEPDEHARVNGPMVTRISLTPLTEQDIIEYVGATLCRTGDEVLPLALVIQSKSAGNPFYMREMLSACHRKRIIWYDYRDSQWLYDLDKLFEQFRGEKDYDVLDTAFITRRLGELPPASRALLSWAALIGTTFSFELIARLMSGEFEYDTSEFKTCCAPSLSQKGWTEREAILGLQAAIQAYIIVPADTDDRFKVL
jgi:serine/threonine protein kinase